MRPDLMEGRPHHPLPWSFWATWATWHWKEPNFEIPSSPKHCDSVTQWFQSCKSLLFLCSGSLAPATDIWGDFKQSSSLSNSWLRPRDRAAHLISQVLLLSFRKFSLGDVFSVDLSIFLWRTEPVWWLSTDQSTSEIIFALLSGWYWWRHFLLFSPTAHHQLQGCFIYTGLCEIPGTGASSGLIHLKLLAWEKWLIEKRIRITDDSTVGPVVLCKGGQCDHHTSDGEVKAETHEVINPRTYNR